MVIRNNGISVPPEIEQANALTRFAVEARYPGDIEPITPEDVALAIETNSLCFEHRSLAFWSRCSTLLYASDFLFALGFGQSSK
jgi:hypothetical protein